MTLTGERPARRGIKSMTIENTPSDHVRNMTVFLRELGVFSASCGRLTGGRTLVNICTRCLDRRCLGLIEDAVRLSALGLCGQCQTVSDVYDLGLLRLNRAFGLSGDDIAAHLPLLRQDFPYRPRLSETAVLKRLSGHLASRSSGHEGASR
jgi:hypothetical protein